MTSDQADTIISILDDLDTWGYLFGQVAITMMLVLIFIGAGLFFVEIARFFRRT